MPDRCTVCQQKTEPEPGFYFGAMFLSYIMSAFPLLGIGLGAAFILDWSMNAIIALLLIVGALFFIKILRFSRSLWIHMMVRYEPDSVQKEMTA